jgi:hypothetical protein
MLEIYPWYNVYVCYGSFLEAHLFDDCHICEEYTWYMILVVIVHT